MESSEVLDYFSTDIRERLEVHVYKRNEFICRELEELNRLYFIVEGRVKMYQTHRNGKISLISFYSVGSILGEIELLGVMETAHSVQAVEDTVCIELPLYEIREVLLKDSVFLLAIAKYLGYKAIQNADNMMKSQAYTLESRLAAFILLSSPNNRYEEKHMEASQYLGVSYRHLLRTIATFVKNGYLVKESGGYTVLDKDMLEHLSEEMVDIR